MKRVQPPGGHLAGIFWTVGVSVVQCPLVSAGEVSSSLQSPIHTLSPLGVISYNPHMFSRIL